MEQIKDRILRLISHYAEGNKAEFARMVGERPQTINSWCTRTDIGSTVVNKICERLPEVRREWLLVGVGEMFDPESGKKENPIYYDSTRTPQTESKEYLSIIKEQIRQSAKYQEQIDRLITLLENAQNITAGN